MRRALFAPHLAVVLVVLAVFVPCGVAAGRLKVDGRSALRDAWELVIASPPGIHSSARRFTRSVSTVLARVLALQFAWCPTVPASSATRPCLYKDRPCPRPQQFPTLPLPPLLQTLLPRCLLRRPPPLRLNSRCCRLRRRTLLIYRPPFRTCELKTTLPPNKGRTKYSRDKNRRTKDS